jgi:glycosyltransferase involved in cell wall biosynthesis
MPFDQFIDRRIVIDKYLKDYYCKRYPIDPGRIDVIYNGISDESYGHAKELAARPRGPYSPQSRICIAYVGRLDTDKSTMRLIKIAKRCGDAKIPIKIEIYGDGPARHDMEQCARNYGILGSLVQFHGFVDSPLEVMAVADFTILTSNAEGIPMSVLESMSCGIPPIVPAVGGIPEMVRHGVDGFLCEISDVHDEDHKIEMFVDAITLAAHLEPGSYRDMQQNCQITVNDRFRSMHHDYSQLLQKATP